jgi:hypothetical protein
MLRWEAMKGRRLVLYLLELTCGPLEKDVRLRIIKMTDNHVLALAGALQDFNERADLDRWLADRDPQ